MKIFKDASSWPNTLLYQKPVITLITNYCCNHCQAASSKVPTQIENQNSCFSCIFLCLISVFPLNFHNEITVHHFKILKFPVFSPVWNYFSPFSQFSPWSGKEETTGTWWKPSYLTFRMCFLQITFVQNKQLLYHIIT